MLQARRTSPRVRTPCPRPATRRGVLCRPPDTAADPRLRKKIRKNEMND